MSPTIPEVAESANDLYTALTTDLSGIDLNLPELELPTDFELPDEDGPAYQDLVPITIDDLTTKELDGTGVFDSIMASLNVHMAAQFEEGRITGGDYAKVYLGAVQGAMQFGVQFLLGKDRAYLENLRLQAEVQTAQINRTRAVAEFHMARAQIQKMQYDALHARFLAYTTRNQYATSKMDLVTGYNGIVASEHQINLVIEQVDAARAQTKDTLADGSAVQGVIAQDKALKEAQVETQLEGLDTARAQTKDTLLDGTEVGGLVALQKETARSAMEAQRAQTYDSHTDGSPMGGMVKAEIALKTNQGKLVLEQYEAQRGQTRGTLSTGETVVGVLGAQTKLYEQQVTSYKRDGESKALKLLLDTWTARKTIDEGVAVPANIDTPAINTAVAAYLNNLDIN